MLWLRKLLLLLPWVRRECEDTLDEELGSYLEMAETDARQAGFSVEEARFAARRDLGNVLRAKEDVRSEWIFPRLEQIIQDLRYAVRSLKRTPLFTSVAILSLALGIGAANAVFSLVEGMLLKPLAYRDSGQLVYVQEVVPALSRVYPRMPVNVQHFFYWREHVRAFESMAAFRSSRPTLTGSGEPEQVDGVDTTADLFRVLKVEMALGRGFEPGEDKPGRNNVVVITDSLWRRQFHGVGNIIGQNIVLDGKPATVVGVLRPDFTFPKGGDLGSLAGLGKRTEVFQPLQETIDSWDGDYDYSVIGRLTSGMTVAGGISELAVLTKQLAAEHHVESQPRPEGHALQDVIAGSVRKSLMVLLAAVLLLLLIVCVNLANLMLARANGRMREFSIRTALGAGRRRLVQQMLTEASVLSFFGGGLGIALSGATVRLFVATSGVRIPRLDEVQLDGSVLVFSLLITAACTCLFGLAPAYRVARGDLQEAMQSGGRAVTASASSLRLRETLVGLEVALSTVLVFLAGLLVSSLLHLMNVDKGFTEERAIAVDLSLPETQYREINDRNRFFDRALSQVSAIPGVRSAGLVVGLPLRGETHVNGIELEGAKGDWFEASNQGAILINVRFVSSAYFETLGIPLVAGRGIEPQDSARRVTVVSARLAAKVWPGQNPLRKKFKTGSQVGEVEVVGVVRDTYNGRLDEAPTMIAYVPYWLRGPNYGSLVVRTASEPAQLMRMIQRTIWSIDSRIPVSEIRTMSEVVDEALAQRRFQMRLAAAFGLGALMLAVIGIYGVVAYNVAQRRGELGLRMALGAEGSALVSLMMKRGLWPVFAGLGAGLTLSVALGGFVRGLLFGVTVGDPANMAVVVLILAVTAVVACWVPASQAARMDPAVVLRCE